MAETELLRRVKALEKDEICIIERQREDIPATARFWRFDYCDHVTDHMIMQNPPDGGAWPMSPRLQMDLPLRPLSASWPSPIFWWDRAEGAEPVHLYRKGDAFLVSEPLLSSILKLDPLGIEHCRAIVENLISTWSWHLVLPVRSIDPIDLPRTHVQLRNYKVAPSVDFWLRIASFGVNSSDGYSIRDDIPPGLHIFANTYGPDVFVSIELIETMRAAGVTGVCLTRAEGYNRLRENRNILL